MDILIADPCSTSRLGIKTILNRMFQCDLAEASNSHEVMGALSTEKDLLIVDPLICNAAPLKFLSDIRAAAPSLKILVLTSLDDESYGAEVIKLGALGYLNKKCTTNDLFEAISKTKIGKPYVSEDIAVKLAEKLQEKKPNLKIPRLTQREEEVFHLLVCGKRVSDIAQLLSLSIKTVSTHKIRVLSKLHCKDLTELVRYAIHQNLTNEGKILLQRLQSNTKCSS